MPPVDLIFNCENLYGYTDSEVYRHVRRIADLGGDLGFEWLWVTEHHFDPDYAMTPDNVTILANLGARSNYEKVATGAVILPWHQPVRVAEKIALLDNLLDGRVVFGMGRGLARMEYEGYGIDMGESRARFDEAAPMILEALETGVIKGDGPFYPQVEREIHPAPTASFKDRSYSVGMSPDSAKIAGQLGVGLLMFLQKDLQACLPLVEDYRTAYRETQGAESPFPIVVGGNMYTHADGATAREEGYEYLRKHYAAIMTHYEFDQGAVSATKGYEAYKAMTEHIQQTGMDSVAQQFAEGNFVGTPDEIYDRLVQCDEIFGNCRVIFGGGIPFDKHEASLKLFAKEVLPALKKQRQPAAV